MRFVFLDRDGVINRFPGKGRYVTRWKDLRVTQQALRGIRRLTKAGFQIAVISNQGCVSRGMITKAALGEMTHRLQRVLRAAGGEIESFHYCYHQTSDGCSCKKPKTRLLKDAFRGVRLRRSQVYFIGDSVEDMQAARRFGCKALLVLSGRTRAKDLKDLPVSVDAVKKNLDEASKWLIQKK